MKPSFHFRDLDAFFFEFGLEQSRTMIWRSHMFFKRTREKELKMVWEIEKVPHKSFLIGTAHFFPYSFRSALQRCLQPARTVMFEGPLDPGSMEKVVSAGRAGQSSYHIFKELDRHTVDRITREVAPKCRDEDRFLILNLRNLSLENPVYEMVKGMKPWLAFFTLWSNYLKRNGWIYSVDLEGYRIAGEMGKEIVCLETIEEQITVLENLSLERIIDFLNRIDEWHVMARDYVNSYLAGDLEKLKTKGLRFPSRHHSVINPRDEIFFERMVDYLERGDAVVFVGAPHISGLNKFIRAAGYHVRGLSVER